MKTDYPDRTIGEIARFLNAEPASGLDENIRISGIAALAEAGPNDISWVDGKKWIEAAQSSQAGVIIGDKKTLGEDFLRALYVTDTQAAMADLLDWFVPPDPPPPRGVHPTAVVDKTAQISPTASIGPNAIVGARTTVGDKSIIHGNVSLGNDVQIGGECELFEGVVVYNRCTIGNRVRLHGGAIIGGDGFGYIFRDGRHRKLRHIGTVVIEDDVEIGANTTVDRAKVGETRIGRGSKIDNLVMVAHNVQIGPMCILVGHVGLSGSVRLGAGCVLGGHVGVADGVSLADGTKVAAWSGVMTSFEKPNMTLFGAPAQEHTAGKRDLLRVKRLPQWMDRLTALEKKVAEFEGATDHRETG